jgi:hypothetical protein
VGQLCDEIYSVLFNINEVTILDSTPKKIMKESRDSTTGLWRINLSQNKNRCITAPEKTQIQSVNNIYSLCNTGALVNYLHNSMFSCTKSDLIHAVNIGHLATWPGLTEDSINKHLRLTPATAMSHMNQKRQKSVQPKKRYINQMMKTSPLKDQAIKHTWSLQLSFTRAKYTLT